MTPLTRLTYLAGCALVVATGIGSKLSICLATAAGVLAIIVHDEWPARGRS